MKKTIKALKPAIIFLLVVSSFISCDKDFNTLESDVLGKGNTNFLVDSMYIPISAYNKKLNSVQINDLASNLLGVFNDPAYGQTSASIVTQVTPTAFSPDFGENPEIESVILNIPYFSTINGIDSDGNSTYALDSLYGNPIAPVKLTIYQNNYFLRDFDPNATDDNTQKYYSNGSSIENSVFNGGTNAINFDDQIVRILYQDNFIPSSEVRTTDTGTADNPAETRFAPAFNKDIAETVEAKAFWKSLILDKEEDAVLSNANNFRNYFRGLYFKAEAIGDDGSMILINLAANTANITINFKKGSTDNRTDDNYVLNFSGNKVNTFINNYDKVTLANGDQNLGDETLYLKGTEGSMAIVDLFPNDSFEDFKNEFIDEEGNFKKLINEAHLVIYEDETIDVGTNGNDYHKYDRIYAYDVKNNTPIIDYVADPTENTQSPLNSRVISLGQRDPDEKKYKIRITEHLKNILLLDDPNNTKIGLVISNNVNYTNSVVLLESSNTGDTDKDVNAIPAATILSPRGTILHGSHENVIENKRLRLKIFFTEPN